MTDKLEEKFETWLMSTGEHNLSKDDNGKYLLNTTQLAWEAWQASKSFIINDFSVKKPQYEEQVIFIYKKRDKRFKKLKFAIGYYTTDPNVNEYIEGEPFFSDSDDHFEYEANRGDIDVLYWVSIDKLIDEVSNDK